MKYLTRERIGAIIDEVEHADLDTAREWQSSGTNVQVFFDVDGKWMPLDATHDWKLVPINP